MAKAFLVNAVPDSLRYVPFHWDIKRSQTLRGVEQRLDRDELILVAVDEQYRRSAANFNGEDSRVAFFRRHKHPGVADDRRRSDRPTQADMQGHHGALAEPDQRERGRRKIMPFQFSVEKAIENRGSGIDADPTFVRVTKCEGKPFTANRRLATRAWRVW